MFSPAKLPAISIPLAPLFDRVSDPIIAVGRDETIIYANDSFARFVGLDSARIMGARPPYPFHYKGALFLQLFASHHVAPRPISLSIRHSSGRFVSVQAFEELYYQDGALVASVALLQKIDTPFTEPLSLTRREHEVFDLLLQGKNLRKIAAELDIKLNTVRNHIKEILFKWDVPSQMKLLAKARKLDQLSPNSMPYRLDIAKLSPREKEVAVRLADGMNNTEIARELGISVYTNRNHTKSIFRKLAIHSQMTLILYWPG